MPGVGTKKPTFCPRTLRFRSQKPHRAPGSPDSPPERRVSTPESRISAPESRASAPGDEFLPPEDEFPYENVEFEPRSMEFPHRKHGAGGGNDPFNEIMRRRVACPPVLRLYTLFCGSSRTGVLGVEATLYFRRCECRNLSPYGLQLSDPMEQRCHLQPLGPALRDVSFMIPDPLVDHFHAVAHLHGMPPCAALHQIPGPRLEETTSRDNWT